MKTLSSDMQAHIASHVTTLCTCIKVIRRDGSAYHFTDHDLPVTCLGETYLPNYGFARTSITTTVQLEIDSSEIKGVMLTPEDPSSEYPLAFTRDDIDAGLFDYAVVYIYLANYAAPDMAPIPIRRGWLGEIESNEDGSYKCELRSLKQVLATRVGEAYSPTCRADLGDTRCKVVLSANRWLPNNGYLAGDRVLGLISSGSLYEPLTVVNGDFEEELPSSDPGPTVPGFVSYGDSICWWTRQSNYFGVVPQSGSFFIAMTNQPGQSATQGGLTQQVSLITGDVTEEAIDTGLCRMTGRVWACTSSYAAYGRFRLVIQDENGVTLSTIYDSGQFRGASDKFVEYGCDNALIPVGGRTVLIDLWSTKKSSHTQGTFFDSLDITVNLPQGTYNSFSTFGGVGFVAGNTGTSGSTEPSWSNEIGATFNDNGIVWTCVKGQSDVATVTTLSGTDPKSFYASSLTEVAGYFDGGVLTWETGVNAGKSSEVKTWKGGLMTMLFHTFKPISVGDRFVVYPGCDKTKSTCVTKFNNIINFRGEPDVPGQDRYVNVANSG